MSDCSERLRVSGGVAGYSAHVHVEQHFPPTAQAPRSARAWLRSVLDGTRHVDLLDTASLLVTELVTNSVLHARTDVVVTVHFDDRLRIEVADADARAPQSRPHRLEAATGRGLQLVDMLATRWGCDLRENGKSVWCELAPAGADGDAGAAEREHAGLPAHDDGRRVG